MSHAIETLKLTKRFPLTKRYRELILNPFSHPEVPALDDVSLHVSHGEVFGVLGPNGSGKTTLIKILSTLIRPTAGNAFINGMDVVSEEKEIRKQIGYVVSDERSFFWRLTGRQNLRFFASLNNIRAKDSERRVDELTDLLDLGKKIDTVFQNYSSGNKQKMAVARGLITDPDILFLDEPTRNLDPLSAVRLRHFIKHTLVKESGKTVLIATNNLEETEEMCDRAVFIQDGRVMKSGTIEELKKTVNKQYVIRLNAAKNQIESALNSPDCACTIVSLSPLPDKKGPVNMIVEISREKGHISDVIEFLVNMGIGIESLEHRKQALHRLFTKGLDD